MSNLLTFADVMSKIGGILIAIVILLVMVTIHEFGHYVAGKALGFKITEFSVGFGPAIFKKRSKKSGEQFSLRVIPLGGYCAFDGEDDGTDEYGGYYANLNKQAEPPEETPREEISESERAEIDELFQKLEEETPEKSGEKPEENYPEPKGERFINQAPWKRIIVLVAGALMNYLLALVLTVLLIGIYGAPRYEITVTDASNQDAASITSDAFLVNEGDAYTILSIDGKKMYLSTDYQAVLDGKKAGDQITIELIKSGETTPESKTITLARDVHFANMSDLSSILHGLNVPSGTKCSLHTVSIREDFFGTIGASFEYSFKLGGSILRSLGELLTGKLGMDAVGGPVSTIGATAQAASYGFRSVLNIGALIGVNLAVFNLLPVPALDGCKVIFCLIEWIRKKPVNRKVEAIIHFAGILLIFGFAIFVDFAHLF